MNLNPEMIKTSFLRAKPFIQDITETFYKRLLCDHPNLKQSFDRVDMVEQQRSLIHSLSYIVNQLENREKLQIYIKSLLGRQEEYGLMIQHFELYSEALITTFKEYFRSHWTEALNQQWTLLFKMLHGMLRP